MLCCGMPGNAHSASAGRPDKTGVYVQKILGSVDQLRARVDGKEQDLQFLTGLLNSVQWQSLIKVHETVATPDENECRPVCKNLLDIAREVSQQIQPGTIQHPESSELFRLLTCPHFQALMSAHDQIAESDFGVPVLPDIPYEVDEDDDAAVKIIRLIKSPTEPLGATLQVNDDTGIVYIARVMHGGAADRCGLIQPGDELREVNGVNVIGKQPDEVIRLITESDNAGPVILTLVPGDAADCDMFKECKVRVRAQFSYNPAEDQNIPCHEAGLAFRRGDILEIVSQEDLLWWQARLEGSRGQGQAGLIPSRLLQERREAAKLVTASNVCSDNKENKGQKVFAKSSPKLNKKTKKSKKSSSPQITEVAEHEVVDELVSYEEVDRYCPKAGQLRPLVLIGPPGVGRTELKRRLISSAPEHFKEPVPYTTRPMRAGEVDGEEYFFVSRADMETDMQNKRFIECGEYNGNFYGTTYDQVKSILNSGLVCVMCPNPQSLRALRCAQLKPYVVFVKPVTSLDQLVTSRANASRKFTEDELKEMLNVAAKLDSVYGHYFDFTLVNDDLEVAASELLRVAAAVETESLWVPESWTR